MSLNIAPTSFRLRSFVRRDSRQTAAQALAYTQLWPQFGLTLTEEVLQPESCFARSAPTFLEIGFGMGASLLSLASLHPDKNFIGVETHKPGVGALLLGVQMQGLTNLRVYHCDVIDVLQKGIASESLDGIQIFFPDPWQKRRHHARRLIQPAFLKLVLPLLKPQGSLHLATDWEDYAKHMMRVLSAEKTLINLAGEEQFAERSIYRPILSKFEQRALHEGRGVWELQFQKK